MKKKLASEEIARLRRTVLTREATRAEADVLFGEEAARMRRQDREKMEKLFVQTPGAVTMAPNLQKQSSVSSSVSPNVDALFEKLSTPQWDEAQTRYPELQKVAYADATVKMPDLKKRVVAEGSGPVKRQSDLSGGSA